MVSRRRAGGDPGALTEGREGDVWTLSVSGRLDVRNVGALDSHIRMLNAGGASRARIDLSNVEALDTAGAWILHRLRRRLAADGVQVEITGIKDIYAALFERVQHMDELALAKPRRENPLVAIVLQAGEQTIARGHDVKAMTAFFGLTVMTFGRLLLRPARLRFTSLVFHMQQAGLNAIPITALLSMLIGVVLAFQGADQLRRFGAEIFTVNLIGISVLREIGVLMTSIIIAGRSGSAFTAQIGTMKVNQEVDAMRTLGLDPVEVLVMPRMIGLILTLPLLVFFADIMGLLGGGIMSLVVLDITPTQYLNQLHGAIGPWTFWVGIIKAPVFAFVIAMIGCYEGLQVTGSAESVGKLTTKSVVESIFMVILLDAMFSVLFAEIGI